MCLFSCPHCLLSECCFCIPIREGCIVSGVFLVITRLLAMFFLVAASDYRTDTHSVIAGMVLEVITIISCFNAFSYLYGVFQESLRSLFLYISLELAYYPINSVYRVYVLAYHTNNAIQGDKKLTLRCLIAMATFSGVEAYLIWVACSFYLALLRKNLHDQLSR